MKLLFFQMIFICLNPTLNAQHVYNINGACNASKSVFTNNGNDSMDGLLILLLNDHLNLTILIHNDSRILEALDIV